MGWGWLCYTKNREICGKFSTDPRFLSTFRPEKEAAAKLPFCNGPVCAAEGSGEGFVGCGRAMPFAVHPAWAGVVTGFGPPGRRPLRWIAMPFTVHPALAVGGAGQAGADSASDTPRRMSGWWSQCPWGKSSAPTERIGSFLTPTGGFGYCRRVSGGAEPRPYGGVSIPCVIYPGLAVVGTLWRDT